MKKIVYICFFLACLVSFSFINFGYSEHPCAYLDTPSGSPPKKYRTTKDAVAETGVELKGLKELSASGSGQFSEEGLKRILKNIPAENVTIVDLRQESHGFINGRPVLWLTNANNDTNKDKNLKEIEQDEECRFNTVYEEGKVILYSESGSEEMIVHSTNRERDVARKLGAQYLRLPVQDHHKPSNQVVDEFVRLIVSLPPGHWLHLHCKGGSGRTTTFMTMYDMMKNARQVSFNDIIKRQHLLGGKNLFELDPDSCNYEPAVARLEFVKAFYRYCQAVPDFKISWSDWVSSQKP